MVKRGKLEIMKDILQIIKENKNSIKITPLIRKSNLSSLIFKEYYNELLEGKFIVELFDNNEKYITLSEKGFRFLEKYKTIISFIGELKL